MRTTIAVLGNPNSGKTTLFNSLTGARQRVGNWAGVTVEKKTGLYTFGDRTVHLVDLPGTYSLDVGQGHTSLDERLARNYVLSQEASLYINVVDASNIERNLYLTTQMLEMKCPLIVVLNMMDVARKQRIDINVAELSRRLGCPVVAVVGHSARDADTLKSVIEKQLSEPMRQAPVDVRYSSLLNEAVTEVGTAVACKARELGVTERWLAVCLLEGDQGLEVLMDSAQMAQVREVRERLTGQLGEDVDILFADQRYTFIGDITAQAVNRRGMVSRGSTEKIDSVVLNRFLGIPIFLAAMYLMFMFTINVGGAFIDFFDGLTGTLLVDGGHYLLAQLGAPPLLATVLADGIGGGIQIVSTFVPIIGCLFLFLSFLEDSGYMARAGFIMDRAMRAIGLPGKAFVPVLVGFGCNVPAVMASRTLEQERDRKLTIMMSPFMSCGARLPVYALFAVVFFPQSGQNIVFALYLTGIAVAIVTGLIMKNTLLPGDASPFVMELPKYHLPSLKSMLLRTWERLKSFVIKAGKTIVVMVMVLTLLDSFSMDGTQGHRNSEKSLLSNIGSHITPLFAPMGMREDNWPAAVGIFTGIFAKEAVVSTLNATYSSLAEGSEGEEPSQFDLSAGIGAAFASVADNLSALSQTVTDPLGLDIGTVDDKKQAAVEQGVQSATYSMMYSFFGTQEAAFAYLLFILLYIPCVAVLGAVQREIGKKWAVMVAVWTTFVAYVVATAYYQLATLSLHRESSLMVLALLAGVVLSVLLTLHRYGRRARLSPSALTIGQTGRVHAQ